MWSAARRTTRGGQPRYSDLAIELCLTLGMVFKQPLRQTRGFMRGIAGIPGVEIAVPDFSTLSRRGNGVILQPSPRADKQAAIHLVVDSKRRLFGFIGLCRQLWFRIREPQAAHQLGGS
jgi:hypothetical protein